MNLKNNRIVLVFLSFVIVLSLVLRLYKLDEIPPSLNWDEAAAGYNAWSIANYGRDEFGETFPLIFRSFLDDKHPVHIYASAIFIKIFGLSDFVARLPAALAGVGCVILMFLLGRIWFNSMVGLFAAFFLAISPYNIHFSRGLWETNFALMFFLLGLYCFYKGLSKQGYWFIGSFISFGFSLMSYHSSKVVVPLIILLLLLLYFKKLIKIGWSFYLGIFVFALVLILFTVDPRLLGLARASQNRFPQEEIEKTYLYQKTKTPLLGNLEVTYFNYLKHYSVDYLFTKGDLSPRNSTKEFGQFYWLDLAFGVVGLIVLALKRNKITFVILAWLLLAPLPASLVVGAPQATRALFMMGSIHILAALGAGTLVSKISVFKLRLGVGFLITGLYLYSLSSYQNVYYKDYARENSIDWQYGMKEIVEYVKDNPNYTQVFMTKERSQPYIFFLYYLKYPLPDFLRWVEYNQEKSVSYNLVTSFDKYNFGNWNEIESMPNAGVLYILTSSQYDGLKHKASFDIKKRIRHPGGSDAFFIVTSNL